MGYKNNDPCWDNADDDEPIFVGLGRDPLAALMTKVWAALSEDCQPVGQVTEAIEHAARMLRYCEARNPGRTDERITAQALNRAINVLHATYDELDPPLWRVAGFDDEEDFGTHVLTDLAEMDDNDG